MKDQAITATVSLRTRLIQEFGQDIPHLVIVEHGSKFYVCTPKAGRGFGFSEPFPSAEYAAEVFLARRRVSAALAVHVPDPDTKQPDRIRKSKPAK